MKKLMMMAIGAALAAGSVSAYADCGYRTNQNGQTIWVCNGPASGSCGYVPNADGGWDWVCTP